MNKAIRKKITDRILKTLLLMEPEGSNRDLYKDKFSKMSDKEFETYIKSIKDKKQKINIYIPNIKTTLSVDDLLKAGDDLNIKFFKKIKLFDEISKRYIELPNEYLNIKVFIKRVKQHLTNKMSVPSSDKKISNITEQVLKPDKSSNISQIELQTLLSKGLTDTAHEMFTIRGGNQERYNTIKNELFTSGVVHLGKSNTRSEVTNVVNIMLKAMHVNSNL